MGDTWPRAKGGPCVNCLLLQGASDCFTTHPIPSHPTLPRSAEKARGRVYARQKIAPLQLLFKGNRSTDRSASSRKIDPRPCSQTNLTPLANTPAEQKGERLSVSCMRCNTHSIPTLQHCRGALPGSGRVRTHAPRRPSYICRHDLRKEVQVSRDLPHLHQHQVGTPRQRLRAKLPQHLVRQRQRRRRRIN